jgi:DNA oxidative demethylase
MTNCSTPGWITDHRSYRYDKTDPETGHPWPRPPPVFADLANRVASDGGFDGFVPMLGQSLPARCPPDAAIKSSDPP